MVLTIEPYKHIREPWPFLLLHKVADHPLLAYVVRYLPPMIMVLLVVYSFKAELSLSYDFMPQLICLLLVALLHALFRQALISIIGGTTAYMSLVHFGLALAAFYLPLHHAYLDAVANSANKVELLFLV